MLPGDRRLVLFQYGGGSGRPTSATARLLAAPATHRQARVHLQAFVRHIVARSARFALRSRSCAAAAAQSKLIIAGAAPGA